MFALIQPKRLLAVAALITVGALGFTAYAFTASNTMPATTAAGSGSMAVSGYTITNIDYTLNNANPNNIDQVEFDMNPNTAADATLRLNAGGWTAYACTVAAGHATCDTTVGTQATVAPTTNLEIIAAD
jgi:hypothetical protein